MLDPVTHHQRQGQRVALGILQDQRVGPCHPAAFQVDAVARRGQFHRVGVHHLDLGLLVAAELQHAASLRTRQRGLGGMSNHHHVALAEHWHPPVRRQSHRVQAQQGCVQRQRGEDDRVVAQQQRNHRDIAGPSGVLQIAGEAQPDDAGHDIDATLDHRAIELTVRVRRGGHDLRGIQANRRHLQARRTQRRPRRAEGHAGDAEAGVGGQTGQQRDRRRRPRAIGIQRRGTAGVVHRADGDAGVGAAVDVLVEHTGAVDVDLAGPGEHQRARQDRLGHTRQQVQGHRSDGLRIGLLAVLDAAALRAHAQRAAEPSSNVVSVATRRSFFMPKLSTVSV